MLMKNRTGLIGALLCGAAMGATAAPGPDTSTSAVELMAPYSQIVREVEKHQRQEPSLIVFEVSEGPMTMVEGRVVSTETSSPKIWRHEIRNPAEISRIMSALRDIRFAPPTGDYAGKARYYPMTYKLTLAYNHPYSRDETAAPVSSIALDLSGAYGNVYDFEPLAEALKPYKPGFTAQQAVMRY